MLWYERGENLETQQHQNASDLAMEINIMNHKQIAREEWEKYMALPGFKQNKKKKRKRERERERERGGGGGEREEKHKSTSADNCKHLACSQMYLFGQ